MQYAYPIARFAYPYVRDASLNYAISRAMPRHGPFSLKRARTSGIKYADNSTNHAQLKYKRVKTGKRSRGNPASSLVRSITTPFVDTFRYITSSYSGSGAYGLVFTNAATCQLPVYLFDISCLRTNVVDGVQYFSNPASVLQRDTASGNYQTAIIGARNATGAAASYVYTTESYPTAAINGRYANSAYLDWVQIKLLIYAAKRTPSFVRVQLVQFVDDDYQPSIRSSTTDSTATSAVIEAEPSGTGTRVSEWNAMWQEYVAPLLGNPINNRDVSKGRRMRVIAQRVYRTQPRDNTVEGPTVGTGDQISVNWFHKLGRTLDYSRSTLGAQPAAGDEENPQIFGPTADGNSATHCRPHQRIYMLISGYTPEEATAVSPNLPADIGCSFDLCIRRKFHVLDIPA